MSEKFIGLAAALLAIAVHASGCGDGGNKIEFLECGNGTIDGNEECDDGNVDNNDECLNTCVFATCGDEFVRTGVEQCDGTNLALQTCATRGFASGTLRCTSSCQFDTSQCSGTGATPGQETPTPQVTPTAGGTGSETLTPGGGTPVATATPTGGSTCQQGSMITITVAVAYDQTSFPDVSGGTTAVKYPAGLDVPGNQSGTDQSRGMNLTGTTGGFFNVSDQDSNADNIDDQVVVGLVGTQAFPPGNFASIAFDCAAGTQVPTSGTFTCVADLSTTSGTTVSGATCSVASIVGP